MSICVSIHTHILSSSNNNDKLLYMYLEFLTWYMGCTIYRLKLHYTTIQFKFILILQTISLFELYTCMIFSSHFDLVLSHIFVEKRSNDEELILKSIGGYCYKLQKNNHNT